MADDIVISARVDTTEALRDLAKLEQDRTVDVEIQPINVEKTIKAIESRLTKLNTQLVIAVAEDNTRSVKSLQAKIDALTRRKTMLTIEVDADTRGATAAIDRAAQDQTAEVRVTEDGAAAARAAVDKAAEDQTATVRVKADTSGVDALIGGLGNLPGVGGLDSALSAGGGGGLSGLLSGGAVGGATKLAVAGGAIAGSFTLAAASVGTFVERTKEVDRLSATIGETAEETSRLLVVMKRYGAEARDVGDALLNIQSKAADGSLGDFGVELDADGSALDNLDRIIEAYGRIESNADKAALASAAFGEEGASQFVPIISKGADEWERLRAAVDGGQIIDDEAIAKGERLAEIGRDLGGRWESLKISIGGFFADLLSNIDKAAKAIDEGPIGDAFNKGIEIFGSPLGPEEDQPGFTAGKGTLVGDVPDDLGKAADGAIRLGGELEEAKTQAELLEEATARVKDQINSAIDPFADLAAGDQGVASAVEGLDAQRDALTSINDKIDEAKGKQAELREQLAETDDVAAKAAEGRTQVAKDSAKAAADAEDSRAKAVEDAARRIAEVQAKEAQDAAGAQARLAALTRQRNVLAADGDDPEKVRDLDNQIAVTRRDMAAAKTEAAATIAETNRTLGEQVAKIDQAQSASNAKSAEALAKINATEAEGLAKAAERRAKLEADLAELQAQAGIEIPAGVRLDQLPAETLAEIQAAFPELKIPAKIDTDAAVAKVAQAVASDVAAEVDAGLIPLDQALDETVLRLEFLRAQQVAIGVDPSTLAAFDTIIGRLQTTQAETDKLAEKAAQEAAQAAGRSGASADAAERVGESARAEAKVTVTLDDDQAVAQLGKLTGKQPDADVAVKTPGVDAAKERVDTVAQDRTATVTVEARGLRPILDQLAQIQDRQITVTVNEVAGLTFDPTNPFASLPGNWAGGTMRAGSLARVAEHGPEVFEGRSGQRLVLRGDGAFMAPEAGRVVSGAETARRYPHLVGGAPRAAHRGDVNITVVSPHERLAGVDTHRTWTRIMGGKS